jgi:Arc/MetJ family transcription regulator
MAGTMTSIRINTRLLDEATRILSAKSRADTVHTALREIVTLRRFKKLMKKHASKLKFAGYDR